MTAHSQDPHDNGADYFGVASSRGDSVRRAFKPAVQIGWNIASIFSRKVREARDIALFNDDEAGLAYSRKHQKAISAKIQEMLNYPHQVD